MKLRFEPTGPLRGELRPPSDKSLTHRALMLGAIASGPSEVRLPLLGEDCRSTLHCLEAMGLTATLEGEEVVRLIPAKEWTQPTEALDCGNSGTTMRLLSGLVASRPISATMVGDASLSKRPMRRIADPLRKMGANVEGETPPLTIRGTTLQGIHYASPVASAQIKSCVLLAGLRAEGDVAVTEPSRSRDHTERMLRSLGVDLSVEGTTASLGKRRSVEGFSMTVPADISSAAFPMVAAAMVLGSSLTLSGVGVNPTRTGILDVFREAGIDFTVGPIREELGEPVADVSVNYTAHKKAFRICGDLVPRLIDEIPVLAVLATQCEGVTEIRDARELRVKESDRIEVVSDALRRLGANVETFEDGMAIHGPVRLGGTIVEAHGDHRIAMAFAVAGLVSKNHVEILGGESIRTSYPTFINDLAELSNA